MKKQFGKISGIIGLIFVLCFSHSMSASFGQNMSELPNLYKKANEHFMLGEYHEAIELHNEILEISPDDEKTLVSEPIL